LLTSGAPQNAVTGCRILRP